MKIREVKGWNQPGGSAVIGGPYVLASDYPQATFKGVETYKDARADHLVVKGEYNNQEFKVVLMAEPEVIEKIKNLLLANLDKTHTFAEIGELEMA